MAAALGNELPYRALPPRHGEARGVQTDGSGRARGAAVPDVLRLQRMIGNRAATRMLAGPPAATVQRVFQHQGRGKTATTYGPGASLPTTIHGAKPLDLRKLADDDHRYGSLEKKADVTAAMAVHAARHPPLVDATPLDELFDGNVTVLDVARFADDPLTGPVRVTFQVDWLQGKHDQPFMKANTTKRPRTPDGTQMRRGLTDYAALARGVPSALARQRLANIFGTAQRTTYNFSVMATKQSDDLYYEISARWATSGQGRHVLVDYHCFPDKEDEHDWR